MKKIVSFFILPAALIMAVSCLNDEYLYDYDDQKPVIELPWTDHELTFSYGSSATTVDSLLIVNYTIADYRDIDEDIPVVLDIDESLLDDGVLLLPQSSYNHTFPKTMTIVPWDGIVDRTRFNYSSVQEKLTINLYDSNLVSGQKYGLPVYIKSAPDGYTISGNFSTMVYYVTVP